MDAKEEERQKSEEATRKKEEQEGQRKLAECKGKTAEEALEVAKGVGYASPRFTDSNGNDITSDFTRSTYASEIRCSTVLAVEETQHLFGKGVAFRLDYLDPEARKSATVTGSVVFANPVQECDNFPRTSGNVFEDEMWTYVIFRVDATNNSGRDLTFADLPHLTYEGIEDEHGDAYFTNYDSNKYKDRELKDGETRTLLISKDYSPDLGPLSFRFESGEDGVPYEGLEGADKLITDGYAEALERQPEDSSRYYDHVHEK